MRDGVIMDLNLNTRRLSSNGLALWRMACSLAMFCRLSFSMRRIVVLLCVLCAAASAPAAAHHEAQPVNRAYEGWPVDDFTLTDHHGKAFTREQLRGRWTFVLFGDTRCAEPCAAALSAMTGLSERIFRSDAILTTQVLFVSLDPARDTPARLQKYLASYDKHFIGVTGAWPTLKRLADDLGVAGDLPADAKASSDGRRYRGSLVLVGPDGFVRAEYLAPFNVPYLTADYLKTRARR